MGFACILTRAAIGLDAPRVRVEAHVDGGLPSFNIVGLPETAVRESRDRVRSAIRCSEFEFPQRRITVNLSPADLPKTGGRYDLPIALAVLAAAEAIRIDSLHETEVLGELSLGGEVLAVRGILGAVQAASGDGHAVIVPAGNAAEAAMPDAAKVQLAHRLTEVTAFLKGKVQLDRPDPSTTRFETLIVGQLDDVIEHRHAKRGLIVAASGGHNLLMRGPPGTGKSLLARCLPGLLPPLGRKEAMEVAAIHSVAGHLQPGRLPGRPFRAPHHSASAAALVGGGSNPLPGEISLAHHGVLFLDELPEFNRAVLETLREPLERREVSIARARARVVYPAAFQLVAAMNPCPAGHDCQGGVQCVCPPDAARRYQARLSGPLLDRIDLHVNVPAVPIAALAAADRNRARGPRTESEDHEARRGVRHARERAMRRQGCLNAHLDARNTELHCALTGEARELLEQAATRLGLSARAWHRCMRTARTIADLAASVATERTHIAEALSYRSSDAAPGRGSEP